MSYYFVHGIINCVFIFKELETYLKENGCKSIFLLAKDAEKSKLTLDTRSLNYLADKLVQFIEYRDATGLKVEPQDVADSISRLMSCVKAVSIFKISWNYSIIEI